MANQDTVILYTPFHSLKLISIKTMIKGLIYNSTIHKAEVNGGRETKVMKRQCGFVKTEAKM